MNKSLSVLILATVLLFSFTVIAADRVVVIPLNTSPGLNTCPEGLTLCSDQCVDTMNNPDFCGDCETVCDVGFFCDNGVCKNQIGATCTAHDECLSGKCTTLGACAPQSKFVFVSSNTSTGNLGGLNQADSTCQGLADTAGMPGTYKAWLSDSTGSPASRFTKSTVPYILVDGTEVAANWDDLTDGKLIAAINKNQNNAIIYSMVWSNTDASTAGPLNNSCNDWSSGDSLVSGGYGGTGSTESTWTNSSYQSCSSIAHIFCFEQ